jgi:hypothetical protein
MRGGELTVKKNGTGAVKVRMPDGKEHSLRNTLVYNM